MAVLQTSSIRKPDWPYRQRSNQSGNRQELPLLAAIAHELRQTEELKLGSLLTARQLLQDAFHAIDRTRNSTAHEIF